MVVGIGTIGWMEGGNRKVRYVHGGTGEGKVLKDLSNNGPKRIVEIGELHRPAATGIMEPFSGRWPHFAVNRYKWQVTEEERQIGGEDSES